ncbi:MAG TPA: hypothetical protein H9797_00965 [Candidatus Gallimonas gallistercoris]|uniref:Uncharacterized protein n=1 Tax=Candidatus Gallimonas gallistercoris TaxID=2838602 RepID=A0A9D2H1B7_9FIRM|nr:hypothetical protein [Candidatus Gallimonas gallistercoris]
MSKFRENLFAPQKSFREFKQKYLQIESRSGGEPSLRDFIFSSHFFVQAQKSREKSGLTNGTGGLCRLFFCALLSIF